MTSSAEKIWDSLWLDAHIATLADGELGVIEGGAIAVKDGRIAWLGKQAELPNQKTSLAKQIYHVKGQWITPGLIDCHTHLVYAGSRYQEFVDRLNGISYAEIAKRGGGIRATVSATRQASEQTLFDSAMKRLKSLVREGVTSIEIKSGYGLDLESELKLLRVIKQLSDTLPIRIHATFLGAHAIPPEYATNPDAYVDALCQTFIPQIAEQKLASAVDVFCETIAFTPEQTQRIFEAATHYGLAKKLHADQLSNSQGAQLAATNNALSADHLEYTDEASLTAMAQAGTVAVLLPGAFYFLRETKKPFIAELRSLGIPMAIATDHNPGTSPCTSLLLMMNMACTLFRFTPIEALQAVTCHAARALGDQQRGKLVVGHYADFALWDIEHPFELCYRFGANPCHTVVASGEILSL